MTFISAVAIGDMILYDKNHTGNMIVVICSALFIVAIWKYEYSK